jgi:hypothetical protein
MQFGVQTRVKIEQLIVRSFFFREYAKAYLNVIKGSKEFTRVVLGS